MAFGVSRPTHQYRQRAGRWLSLSLKSATEEHVLRLFTLRLVLFASLVLVAAANGGWKWEPPLL
jgi:hypothetical protein